jgi:hypothetical protein
MNGFHDPVGLELELFRRRRNPMFGNMYPRNIAPALPPTAAEGILGVWGGNLVVAPEDPPFPPSVCIPIDQIVSFVWGAGIIVAAFLFIIYCRTHWPFFFLVLVVWAIQKAYSWGSQTAKFNQEQDLKQKGRWLPDPNILQHYVVAPLG